MGQFGSLTLYYPFYCRVTKLRAILFFKLIGLRDAGMGFYTQPKALQ